MNFTSLMLSIVGLIISICFLIMVLYDKYIDKKHPNPNPYILITICHIAAFIIFIIKLL